MLENDDSVPSASVLPSVLTPPPESDQQSGASSALINGKNAVVMPKPVYESDNHLPDLQTFAESMSAATQRCLKQRKKFDKVLGVVSYWQNPKGLQHLTKNAQKLAKLFNVDYEFDVMDYEIPRDTTELDFTCDIGPHLKKVKMNPNALFIFYYGGHASAPDPNGILDEKRYWMPENRLGQDDPRIEWSNVRHTLFSGAKCQVLFLLDCCHAGSMINDHKMEWAECEMLAACPPSHKASADELSSFTAALYEELKTQQYDILELHATLCSTEKRIEHRLKSDPWYRHFTSNALYGTSAMVRKLEPPSSHESNGSEGEFIGSDRIMARLKRTSNAKVLIAVTFKGTASGVVDKLKGDAMRKEFENWFRRTPNHVLDLVFLAVRQVTLESCYESNSCITTWSMPVWLWDCLAYNPQYKYLGVIRSTNVAAYGTKQLGGQGPNGPPQSLDSSLVPECKWTLVRAVSEGLPNTKPVHVQPDDSSSTSGIDNPPRLLVPTTSPPIKLAKTRSPGGLFSGLSKDKQSFNILSPSRSQKSQTACAPTQPMSYPTKGPLMIPQSFEFGARTGRFALKMEDVVRTPSDKKYARKIDETRLSRRWGNSPIPI